ncbi:MAG: BON domain-containing protein [Thermoanaerobaculia bacterium]
MTRRASSGRTGLLLVLLLVLLGALALWLWNARDREGLETTVSSVQQASVDAITTAKVKTALALSERVAAFDVDVDSVDGTVTLEGDVASDETRQLAEDIARETSGVEQVRNRLRVDPGVQPDAEAQALARRMEDLEIKAAVQEGLLAEPDLRDAGIAVRVDRGLVRLEGTVPDTEHRLRAELAARGAPGVRAVDNALSVPAEAAPADRDLKLAEAVEFALYSTKAFDLDPVVISAYDGTVSLEGPVRSRAEQLLAERIAAGVEGVQSVANALEVRTPPAEPARTVPPEPAPEPL